MGLDLITHTEQSLEQKQTGTKTQGCSKIYNERNVQEQRRYKMVKLERLWMMSGKYKVKLRKSEARVEV